jgi:hypothetical protein
MDDFKDLFCPVCKIENLPGALICAFCNAPLNLEGRFKPPQVVEEIENPDPVHTKKRLLVFVPGFNRPIQLDGNRTVILGRNLEKNCGPDGESILDLTPFEALDRGVSRQHVLVRPVEDGFEIYDLGSTNGTWLNHNRILPGRTYPLDTESEIQLGRMVLRIIVGVASGKTDSLAR